MPAYIQCLGLNYEAERLGVAGDILRTYSQDVSYMFMWFDLLMTKMFSYASGCKPTWNCVMGFLNG